MTTNTLFKVFLDVLDFVHLPSSSQVNLKNLLSMILPGWLGELYIPLKTKAPCKVSSFIWTVVLNIWMVVLNRINASAMLRVCRLCKAISSGMRYYGTSSKLVLNLIFLHWSITTLFNFVKHFGRTLDGVSPCLWDPFFMTTFTDLQKSKEAK